MRVFELCALHDGRHPAVLMRSNRLRMRRPSIEYTSASSYATSHRRTPSHSKTTTAVRLGLADAMPGLREAGDMRSTAHLPQDLASCSCLDLRRCSLPIWSPASRRISLLEDTHLQARDSGPGQHPAPHGAEVFVRLERLALLSMPRFGLERSTKPRQRRRMLGRDEARHRVIRVRWRSAPRRFHGTFGSGVVMKTGWWCTSGARRERTAW